MPPPSRRTSPRSPTNIAAYLWSIVAAEDLRLISRAEAKARLGPALATLDRLERAHGFFFNWYDTRTGERVRIWPGGSPVRPFLSTVDNGWLAAALMVVGNTWPEFRGVTDTLLAAMDFGFFYTPYDAADAVAHSLRWLSEANQADGFPAPEYVSIGHALVRIAREISGTKWTTTTGSAWIRFFMWLQPYLQADTGPQAVRSRSSHQEAAREPAAGPGTSRGVFDPAVPRDTAELDVFAVTGPRDDDEAWPLPAAD